jgi:hypothetical protein
VIADFTCRRCAPPRPLTTAMELEDHLVHVHKVARDVARAAIEAAEPGRAPAPAPRPKENPFMKNDTCSICTKPGHKAPTCPKAKRGLRRGARAKGGGKFKAKRPRAEARNGHTPARRVVSAMFADLERELAAARADFEANAERVDGLARVLAQLRAARA